ncbi:MAG: B12-binding domain-containing radical SAM protein [Armatimonadota bacterium]|nr:B12-binding domain-containing radical SAM protein [Armatimonadota bacterium]
MHLLLVNTNRMRPPVAPIGLDYVGAALRAAGHAVSLLDLCFEDDPLAAVDRALAAAHFQLIGVSLRNTDDCYYPGRHWFLPDARAVVQRVQGVTGLPAMLGGVGFSIMPEAVLRFTGAAWGIRGEGEFALLRVASGEENVPGLVRRTPAGFHTVPPTDGNLADLPPMARDLVDNRRYYREGGQVGFETKRGCAATCIYCADPVAKGHRVRLRPPAHVVYEVAALAAQGIRHLHTGDAEFNRPLEHALAVCEALVERGLGDRIRWYAYCVPTPFPEELARAMRRAGCAGINFGVDSGDDGMLRRLGRDFSADDVRTATTRCRAHGMACMLDLLLGGPGETEESVRRSLEFIRACQPHRIGLSVGVRVYPGTPLARLVPNQPEALHGPGAHTADLATPLFYLSPSLGAGIFSLVSEIVGDDPRFFFSDPTTPTRNYNYSGNEMLVEAIARGYRGAYWDILRRVQEGLPPE